MPKLKSHRGAAKRFKKTGRASSSAATRSSAHPDEQGAQPQAQTEGHDTGVGPGQAKLRTMLPVARRRRRASQIHAESKKRKRPPGEAQEAAQPRQRLLPDQEQALSLGERVGRHGAQVCVRRPPPQEARLPPPVGDADQRRRARERSHLRPADCRAESRRHTLDRKSLAESGGVLASVVREAGRRPPPMPGRHRPSARRASRRQAGAARQGQSRTRRASRHLPPRIQEVRRSRGSGFRACS